MFEVSTYSYLTIATLTRFEVMVPRGYATFADKDSQDDRRLGSDSGATLKE